MKFVKYTFLGALLGFLIGLISAIGTVGISFTGLGLCADGCTTCLGGCVKGWTVDCFSGWGDCLSCKVCTGGGCHCEYCMAPVLYPLDTCLDACEEGGTDCDNGSTTAMTEITEVKSNIEDNSKAKNYLIYLTIIGTLIGGIFGTCITKQEKKKIKHEIEENETKCNKDAEEDRKRMHEVMEFKWETIKRWLSE